MNGCKYCNNDRNVIIDEEMKIELEKFDWDYKIKVLHILNNQYYESFKINYCPMCGRELK